MPEPLEPTERDEADLAAMHAPQGQTAVVELEGPAFYWAADDRAAAEAHLMLALTHGVDALLNGGGIPTTFRAQMMEKTVIVESNDGPLELPGFGLRVSMDLPPGTLPTTSPDAEG